MAKKSRRDLARARGTGREHRTGTRGRRGPAPNGSRAKRGKGALAGAAVAIEEFAVDRLDPALVYLDIGGARIAAVPVFDAPATGIDGIEGRLGPIGTDADIAVVELSPRAVYSGCEFERLRRTDGHRALLVICSGEAPALALINAEKFNARTARR